MLFLLFVSGGLLLSFSSIAITEIRSSRLGARAKQSYFLAEAGVEDVTWRIRQGKTVVSPVATILDDSRALTTVVFSGVANSVQTVESEGDISSAIRRVRIVMHGGTGISFSHAMQAGYLGMKIEERSGVIGNVYSNGSIQGRTGSGLNHITGNAFVARGTAATPDQVQLFSVSGSELPVRDSPERRDGIQSFIPSITADVRRIEFCVKKVNTAGNPGHATVRISADDGGKPKRTGAFAIGQMRNFDVPLVLACEDPSAWVQVAMNSNNPLIQGQKYWIVIENGGDDPGKYYVFGANADDAYDPACSDCTFRYSPNWNAGSPQWISPTPPRDMAFKVFLGSDETFIDMDGGTIGEVVDGVRKGDAHAQSVKNATVERTAYCTNISNSTVGGSLASTCPNSFDDIKPVDLPISAATLTALKQAGLDGGGCVSIPADQPQCDEDGDYTLDNVDKKGTLGPIVIPGKLTVQSRAELTLTGTVYVQGDILLKDSCVVRLDPAFGQQEGVIIVDGTVIIENGCQLLGSGDLSSFLMVITTSPQISGPPALLVKDSSTSAILYAARGNLEIHNRAHLKAVVGQKISLNDSAVLEYDEGVVEVDIQDGPAGGWDLATWNEVR